MKGSLIVLALFASCVIAVAQNIKVMSYNIKYDNVRDTINNWNHRKQEMTNMIQFYAPDVLGAQEVLIGQLSYLKSKLTKYAQVGSGREDGKLKGEFCPIFYNKKRFSLLTHETFWLSDTPKKVSIGWDAALERICTYVQLRDRVTQQKFWVFNTHFDHVGKEARKQSVQLILNKIDEININDQPVVLLGDLNLTPDEKPILTIKKQLKNCKEHSVAMAYGPNGTYNGFDPTKILNQQIDYIFIKHFKVLNYLHIDDKMENNKYLSDHLPVLTTLSINNLLVK